MLVTNFFLIIVVFLINSTAKSIDIDCSYRESTYDSVGSIYYCNVQNQLNITSKQSLTVNLNKGNHIIGKSNDDVEGFLAYGKGVQYFPGNLQNIFKNLTKISITDGRLQEIYQEDLKPFSKLVALYLYSNDIEVLEEGIFAYNPDLAQIDLQFNKLVLVEGNVFESLTKLTHLYLNSNPCIKMDAENNSTALKEVVKTVRNNCTGSPSVTLVLRIVKYQLGHLEDKMMTKFGEMESKWKNDNNKIPETKFQQNSNKWMLIFVIISGFIQIIILIVGYKNLCVNDAN